MLIDFGDDNGSVPAHQHTNGGGWVADTAEVASTVYVNSEARVYGNAQVYGSAQVYGNAKVYGNAWISGNAQVYGDVQVYGNAQVSGNTWTFSPLVVQGSRDHIMTCSYTELIIGCQKYSVDVWLTDYEKIGHKYGYTKEEIEEYGLLIRTAAEWLRTKGLRGAA